MDTSDHLELAIAEYLREKGIPNVYAWGEEHDRDTDAVEYLVMATRIAVDSFPTFDLGIFDVRITTRGGGMGDNIVEAALGPEDQFLDSISPYALKQGLELYEPNFSFPHEKIAERNRKERVFPFQIRGHLDPYAAHRKSGRIINADDREVQVDDHPTKVFQ